MRLQQVGEVVIDLDRILAIVKDDMDIRNTVFIMEYNARIIVRRGFSQVIGALSRNRSIDFDYSEEKKTKEG